MAVDTIMEEQRGNPWKRVLDSLSCLGIGVKISLLLLGLGLVPPLAALLIIQDVGIETFQNLLALYIAGFLVLFYPLGKVMEELIVLRQARHINAFVEEVKAGKRSLQFNLPEEKGDEHDFLRLQRNIFWMVQGLKAREAKLKDALSQLEQAQRQILESIHYASLIQRSVLASASDFNEALGDCFLYWLPRDGVGGDAYWIKTTPAHICVAVFDCTGHGVPGAFLTLIAHSLFEHGFDDACYDDPARLLSKTNVGLKAALTRFGKNKLVDDGLEGGVCCIDRRNNVLYYAGARGTFLFAGKQGVKTIRGDKSGVGFLDVPADQEYTNHKLPLQDIDAVYLFTDGFTDQVGGSKKLPFGRSRLSRWVETHASLPMEEQHKALAHAFEEYKGANRQRDDVTVLGFSTKELSC